MSEKKRVTQNWHHGERMGRLQGYATAIYLIGNKLFFFVNSNDPGFYKNQLVKESDVYNARPYKVVEYNKENIPQDAKKANSLLWI